MPFESLSNTLKNVAFSVVRKAIAAELNGEILSQPPRMRMAVRRRIATPKHPTNGMSCFPWASPLHAVRARLGFVGGSASWCNRRVMFPEEAKRAQLSSSSRLSRGQNDGY